MSEPRDPQRFDGPPRKTLAKAAVWTLLGAVIVTVLFILPAEYGVDPTGVGDRLGLTRLSGVSAPEIDSAPRVVEGTWPPIPAEEEFDYYEPDVLADPFARSQDRPFRTESMVVALAEFEQVEVKAEMKRGDTIVYTWKLVEGDTVYSDFHADPHDVERYPEMYYIRYHESEEGAESGSLVAPFAGNHGWYWLNIEEHPVTIELEVRGYFDSLEEIMRSFQ